MRVMLGETRKKCGESSWPAVSWVYGEGNADVFLDRPNRNQPTDDRKAAAAPETGLSKARAIVGTRPSELDWACAGRDVTRYVGRMACCGQLCMRVVAKRPQRFISTALYESIIV
jgi:hypothetical protein